MIAMTAVSKPLGSAAAIEPFRFYRAWIAAFAIVDVAYWPGLRIRHFSGPVRIMVFSRRNFWETHNPEVDPELTPESFRLEWRGWVACRPHNPIGSKRGPLSVVASAKISGVAIVLIVHVDKTIGVSIPVRIARPR